MDNELLKAAILGIVQGLTEFLPVSSSGHLEIGKSLLGFDLQAGQGLLMTVTLHAATALSTVFVFHHDLRRILSGAVQRGWNDDTAFVAKIVISMVPAAVVGLIWEKQIEVLFEGNLLLVGVMLMLTGLLLFLAGQARHTDRPVGYLHAIVVGVAQAIAILPGISRSGATISTSVLLGIDRSDAARFSFLMVVPLILGKMAKDVLAGDFGTLSMSIWPLLVGFATAFLTGLLACRWMIKLVRNFQLWWFSIYCFAAGGLAIFLA